MIGTGFNFSVALGILTSLAVIIHEIPEGISIYSILSYNNYHHNKALFYSILVAVATPIGALISTLILKRVSYEILGIWLAFDAGSLIYIGASDLIPETHKKANPLNILFVLLGAFIIYSAGIII